MADIIFHKGTTSKAPENSLSGLYSVFDAGGKWIEIDCLLTKDHQIVLMHDESVDKTTDGKGEVREMSYDQIRQLDCGVKFDQKFKGERIPLLKEVLEFCKEHQIKVSIELKGEDLQLPLIAQKLVEEMGVENLITFYAFSPPMLERLDRRFRRHLNIEEKFEKNFNYAMEKGWGINPEIGSFTKEHVMRAKANNLPMHIWTINKREERELMEKWGVDAIITDELLP